MQVKPLPLTFIPNASAFWVRMEPQPYNGHLINMDGFIRNHHPRNVAGDKIHPPHAVGDTLYEREEWRVVDLVTPNDRSMEVNIFFRESNDSGYLIVPESYESMICKAECSDFWQPPSTMPSWAARKRYTVATVEGKRRQELSMLEAPVHESGPYTNDWAWYVTLTELKGESNHVGI